MDKKYSLVEPSPEESPIIVKKVEEFLATNGWEIVGVPFVDNLGALKAKSVILKKVEMVPKEIPVIIPEVVSTESSEAEAVNSQPNE